MTDLFSTNTGDVRADLDHQASHFSTAFTSAQLAAKLDSIDPLAEFRSNFHYPLNGSLPPFEAAKGGDPNAECVYLRTHVVGLAPKNARAYLADVMQLWETLGAFVLAHGEVVNCDYALEEHMQRLVGAEHRSEVSALNGLSVNANLLLAAFFKPSGRRRKILIEAQPFSSDYFAVRSQLNAWPELDWHTDMLVLEARAGEDVLRDDDILETIERDGDDIAIVFISGVHFATGQRFDVQRIVEVAHRKGCLVGLDLAHSIGCTRLRLHEWQVDFACWCAYKYTCGGIGGLGGIFVHERHHESVHPVFEGWWSHTDRRRFAPELIRELCSGARAFRITHPSPIVAATNRAALDLLEEAGEQRLLQKQYLLTGYLYELIDERVTAAKIITPREAERRGAHVAMRFPTDDANRIVTELGKRGFVCDVVLPDVLRASPSALYISFGDVWKFVDTLQMITA